MREHSNSSVLADNVCHICEKTFSTKSNVLRHLREHMGRRFVCNYDNCEAFFTQRTTLQDHKDAKHTGHKRHKCEECGKRFVQTSALMIHMRIHTDEHLFYCDYCEKSFRQKNGILRHFRRHLKPMQLKQHQVQCQECSKMFASRHSLLRHLKQHADFVEETRQEAMKIEKNLLSVEL